MKQILKHKNVQAHISLIARAMTSLHGIPLVSRKCHLHLCERMRMKKSKHLSIVTKIVLTLWTPRKGPRDLKGSLDHTLRTAG